MSSGTELHTLRCVVWGILSDHHLPFSQISALQCVIGGLWSQPRWVRLGITSNYKLASESWRLGCHLLRHNNMQTHNNRLTCTPPVAPLG